MNPIKHPATWLLLAIAASLPLAAQPTELTLGDPWNRVTIFEPQANGVPFAVSEFALQIAPYFSYPAWPRLDSARRVEFLTTGAIEDVGMGFKNVRRYAMNDSISLAIVVWQQVRQKKWKSLPQWDQWLLSDFYRVLLAVRYVNRSGETRYGLALVHGSADSTAPSIYPYGGLTFRWWIHPGRFDVVVYGLPVLTGASLRDFMIHREQSDVSLLKCDSVSRDDSEDDCIDHGVDPEAWRMLGGEPLEFPLR